MAWSEWLDRLAIWRGYEGELQTLLIYGIGIAVYTALIFMFYQNISVRDPFHSRQRPGWLGKAIHTAETILTFPVLSFCYFGVLALSLFLLAKSQTTSQLLMLSMSVVVSVRVTSHVSEQMSNDLAKLVPLSLVAVVVVDPGYLSLETTWGRVYETFGILPTLGRYFLVFILLEAVMRSLRRLLPGAQRLWQAWQHRRTLSKRAMLRDVAHQHPPLPIHFDLHFPKPGRKAHTQKHGGYLTLDEDAAPTPGRGYAGPGLNAERPAASAHVHAPAAVRRPAPRQGPSG